MSHIAAIGWALCAIGMARRSLRDDPTGQNLRLPRVPSLGLRSERGVFVALRLARPTCLTRAVVLQAWHLARGSARDVVIGVQGPTESFRAHAWLDGEGSAGFTELTRWPAVRTRGF